MRFASIVTPVLQPEQNPDIEGVVDAKYVSSIFVHIIRMIYAIISLVVLVGLFALFMGICGCSISWPLVLGSIATAVFLGALGMVVAALSKNAAVSYMAPVV
jgi:hypothetical protein